MSKVAISVCLLDLGLLLGRRFGETSGLTRAGFFQRLRNRPDHVECALGNILELVTQNAFTAVERLLKADQFAGNATELLGGKKRLRQKPFQTSRTADDLAIVRRELSQPP